MTSVLETPSRAVLSTEDPAGSEGGNKRADDVRGPARPWLVPTVAYLVGWMAASLVVAVSSSRLPPNPTSDLLRISHGTGLVGSWSQWDGAWYERIATGGYWYQPGQQSPVAFFPGYPLAIRVLGPLLHDPAVAGVVITTVSGWVSFVLLYRWCLLKAPHLARTTVVLLVAYPYVWYLFGAVYADALFLATTLAAFVAYESDRPVIAGLCGLVATATRPTGAAIVLACAAGHVLARTDTADLWSRRWRTILTASGLAAWCGYLWVTYGQPLLFATVQAAPGWDQPPGWETWAKVDFFRQAARWPELVGQVITGADPPTYIPAVDLLTTTGLVVQAAIVVATIVAIPAVWRRFGPVYGVYTAGVVALLIGSKDLQGSGRYLLAAFPAFVVAAGLLHGRRRWLRCSVAVGVLVMLATASFYGRGYYLA